MRKPLVSAVIVTYNNKKWLEKSIPSLYKQSYSPLEIIVVDNASLDQAADFVREKFPKARVLKRKVNDGFGAGANAGVKLAKGKYVLFANEDMVFDRDYISNLISVMEGDSSIGACQGTIYQIPATGKKLKVDNLKKQRLAVQSTGLFFNYTGVLVGDPRRTSPEKKDPVEIFSATAPFLVRKEFIEAIGGFDEDFFLYFEEVDLCWRIWLTGRRVVYVPQAQVYHKGGGSTGKLGTEVVLEYSVRDRIASFIKNLGFGRLFIGLLVQLLTTASGSIIFLLKGQFKLSFAICKAWLWNIWHFPSTSAKRIRIQRSRVISDRGLFRKVSGLLPIDKLLLLSGLRRSK